MKALYRIPITVNMPIVSATAKARYAVNSVRGAVISACKQAGFSEEEMSLVNFKPQDTREAPIILYAHPIANHKAFDLYGRGVEGLVLIEKIADTLKAQRLLSLSLGNETKEIIIEKIGEVSIEPYLPLLGATQSYYMATPAIFYDKDREHNEWNAISQKYWQKDNVKYETEIRRSVSNLVKSNLLYQIRYVVCEKGEDTAPLERQIEQMEMEITNFHFKIDHYHRDQNMTPMLFMHFRTNIQMPKFIGHHNGRGYGLVGIDKRGGKKCKI